MTQNKSVDRRVMNTQNADLGVCLASLPAQAKHFKYKSQKVSCSYWWKNVKLNVVVVVVVLLIILLLIIILLATGFGLY
uniref:V-SNARE coiled-coil homology domain-containing protein n=1 Tax=Seriola dumerili TaxID=41447 RepID=A0A3B4TL13_SERDU